jgi:hypothetical protein
MKRIALFLTFISVQVSAQNFECEAPLVPVQKDGFYKIVLPPYITSRLTTSFHDIRIYDGDNQETPYLLRDEKEPGKKVFREYPILSKEHRPGCCSHYILHNPEKNSIRDISLLIRNAEVEKQIKLEGSDDMRTWYVLKDLHTLSSISNASGTSELKILDFPLTNYQYIRLEIIDSASAPINILSAGYDEHFSESGGYSELDAPVIRQQNMADKKQSMVTAVFLDHAIGKFPGEEVIDKLELEIKGPPYYLRQARLELHRVMNGKAYYETIQSFEINSFTPHIITFASPLKTDSLRIVIENEDNPPLKIASVNAWQLRRYLISYLEQGRRYTLQFGDNKASRPRYDLAYFSDSLSANLPVAAIGGLQEIKEKPAEAETENSFFKSKAYIWGALFVIIGLLGFISVRMLREMGNSGSSEIK